MSKPTSIAARHWSRILRRWPEDRMRPKWVAMQTIMQKRIDNSLNPTKASASPNGEQPASEQIKGNDALVTPAPEKGEPATAPVPWDEKRELSQANALYSLLENRYMKAYPVPETLRYPQSKPTHYDDLVKEFEEAPDRTWLQRFWLRIKGSVRLQ